MGKMENVCEQTSENGGKKYPVPPPLPSHASTSYHQKGLLMNGVKLRGYCGVSTATRDMWDCLFDQGNGADVTIHTDNGECIFAHACVLGMASPVMKGMLKQAKRRDKKRSISIRGVPHDAVRVFVRYLYSSCYEKEDMEEFGLHFLVLSHAYVVPGLKQECVQQLEQGYIISVENVVDIFQLALLCDAPRLSLICHRIIQKNFQEVSTTEGWKAMKESHPLLEKELIASIVGEEKERKERKRKSTERKIYLQLYDAMEALVHICKDGCKTIGPHDIAFKENQGPCKYEACKGLELLVRHFAGCTLRVPGGCTHCKRMWQLLELHSRLCANSDVCRVPLCKNLKERIRKQTKKDEIRWRILVKKILRTKSIGGSPFFLSAFSYSSSSWKKIL